ncbi:MAG: proton-conducting transporter membrane subunit [Fibrobacterota bacterium]
MNTANPLFDYVFTGLSTDALSSVVEQLWVLLPLFPVAAAVMFLFFLYVFNRDISRRLLPFFLALFGIVILFLTVAVNVGDLRLLIPLSPLPYAVTFLVSPEKTFFLAALLFPVLFSFFHLHQLNTAHDRIVFLLYLTGCSGVIVSGDVFNFFVFFELMIMAAYVLIAINRNYYASIKYMFIGFIGATFLLAAVIVWFRSGYYFSYGELPLLAAAHPESIGLLMMLLSMVFLIKGGIFPAASWPGPCHGSAPTLAASFLSGFTTFTAVYGIYHFVIVPAEVAGLTSLLKSIEILCLVSILFSSLIVFFENRFRFMIAATTPVSVAIVLLLLIGGAVEAGLIYMVVHAFYKSGLFVLAHKATDTTLPDFESSTMVCTGALKDTRFLRIEISRPLFWVLAVCVLFTAALFPALTAFIKDSVPTDSRLTDMLMLCSSFFLVAGFAKFYYILTPVRAPAKQWGFAGICSALFVLLYILFLPRVEFLSPVKILLQAALVYAAVRGGKKLFAVLPGLHCFDSRIIYKTLNHELVAIVMLFVVFNVLLLVV